MTARNRRLLRLVDIAELGGVSRQRAEQWAKRPGFPEPVERWPRGAVWLAEDVQRWLGKPRPAHRPHRRVAVGARTLGLRRDGPGRYASLDGAIEIVRNRDGWTIVDHARGWSAVAPTFGAAKEELTRRPGAQIDKGGPDVR